jgi:hypothetical protein
MTLIVKVIAVITLPYHGKTSGRASHPGEGMAVVGNSASADIQAHRL